jgi:hypothetical protein
MADPGLLVIRRSCCRANTAPSRTSAIGSTARSSNRSRRAHPSPPRGIPGHQLAGIPAAQRCDTQRAPFLSAVRAATMHADTWLVTAGAELLRLNRPGSTSPGGKRAMWPLLDVARGSWYASSWTRATRVARRFRFALTISPSPCKCQCHAGVPGPGPLENGPCPRPAAAGLAGRASGAIAVACQCRALPRPERLRRPVPTGSAVTQCARCQRPSRPGAPALACPCWPCGVVSGSPSES